MFRNVPNTELTTCDVTDSSELVPLAALVGEGFADDLPYVRSARDAVDALADQLGDGVVLDDLGRRCISRHVARELFDARVEADQRQREAQQRRDAEAVELAARTRPRGGVPVGWRWVAEEEEA